MRERGSETAVGRERSESERVPSRHLGVIGRVQCDRGISPTGFVTLPNERKRNSQHECRHRVVVVAAAAAAVSVCVAATAAAAATAVAAVVLSTASLLRCVIVASASLLRREFT